MTLQRVGDIFDTICGSSGSEIVPDMLPKIERENTGSTGRVSLTDLAPTDSQWQEYAVTRLGRIRRPLLR